MPSKPSRTPKDLKIKRLPEKGQQITLRATVTRTGRNTFNTADTVTLRIPGFETPITINADYLLPADE